MLTVFFAYFNSLHRFGVLWPDQEAEFAVHFASPVFFTAQDISAVATSNLENLMWPEAPEGLRTALLPPPVDNIGDGPDVVGCRSAAAAYDVCAGLQAFCDSLCEFAGAHIEDRPIFDEAWSSGVGLGEDGQSRCRAEQRNHHGHLRRVEVAAVCADDVGTGLLEALCAVLCGVAHDRSCSFCLGRERYRGDDGQRGAFLARADGAAGLAEVDHGLDDEAVNAGFCEDGGLLGEGIVELRFAVIAIGFEQLAGRA